MEESSTVLLDSLKVSGSLVIRIRNTSFAKCKFNLLKRTKEQDYIDCKNSVKNTG